MVNCKYKIPAQAADNVMIKVICVIPARVAGDVRTEGTDACKILARVAFNVCIKSAEAGKIPANVKKVSLIKGGYCSMDNETYQMIYKTPQGMSDIIIESDGEVLTRLYFEGSRDAFKSRKKNIKSADFCQDKMKKDKELQEKDKELQEKDKELQEKKKELQEYESAATGESANPKEYIPKGFSETVRWLDIYFGGNVPDFVPKYRIYEGLTDFRAKVLKILSEIPYGKTVTYGSIAKKIAEEEITEEKISEKEIAGVSSDGGVRRMSAQAVGGAVGWNPICIIIPCHRVVGAGGKLVGYGGGISNKRALLQLEMRKPI